MPTVKHGNPIAFIRIEIVRNMKSSTANFSKLWTHLLQRRNNFDSPSIQSLRLGHLRSKAEIGTPIHRLRLVLQSMMQMVMEPVFMDISDILTG
ncbi:unnamed protein product [Lactuca virosa]|uniref:Uncharacterized protein n=1 Tax=Lactuca virosa TaxID=75947 RepID=A0AAU9MQL6_9ASTR|nr:unnamed protein product [Lactuca virosa]